MNQSTGYIRAAIIGGLVGLAAMYYLPEILANVFATWGAL